MISIVDKLPDEVLERIFFYSSYEDLIESFRNVCTRWRYVADSPAVWKKMVYCPNKDKNWQRISENLRLSPKLKTLVLKQRCFKDIQRALTDTCADLRTLQISEFQDSDLGFIRRLKQKCPKLERLRMPDVFMTNIEISVAVGKFSNLKVLLLTGMVETETNIRFQPIADHCTKLEHLEFCNPNYNPRDLQYLLFKRRETLHTLGTCCCDRYRECILPALAHCNLKSLSLFSYWRCYGTKVHDFGRLKTVTSLKIEGLHFASPPTIAKLFDNGNMAQLRQLGIYIGYCFSDLVTDVIVRNCPYLQNMTLDYCYRITDASLKGISTLEELESLTINKNDNITDEGLRHLRNARGLKYMGIGCCSKITKQGLEVISTFKSLETLNLCSPELADLPWTLLLTMQGIILRNLDFEICSSVDDASVKRMKRHLSGLNVTVNRMPDAADTSLTTSSNVFVVRFQDSKQGACARASVPPDKIYELSYMS